MQIGVLIVALVLNQFYRYTTLEKSFVTLNKIVRHKEDWELVSRLHNQKIGSLIILPFFNQRSVSNYILECWDYQANLFPKMIRPDLDLASLVVDCMTVVRSEFETILNFFNSRYFSHRLRLQFVEGQLSRL